MPTPFATKDCHLLTHDSKEKAAGFRQHDNTHVECAVDGVNATLRKVEHIGIAHHQRAALVERLHSDQDKYFLIV
jgi:hydrogenase maturation factor HypE